MAEAMQETGLLPAFVLSAEYPLVLALEHQDGSSVSLPYSGLRHVRYVPEGLVLLRFADTRVDIHGRNLLPVWIALRSRRVKLLRAQAESAGLMRADYEPHISGIILNDAARRAGPSPVPG
jgi:hypothetical protein